MNSKSITNPTDKPPTVAHTLLILLLITSVCSTCTDNLSCFKKKLFNFGFPGESIYGLSNITNNGMDAQLDVLGYGDFNNDLHTDFIAQGLGNAGNGSNANNNLYIYIWSSETENFVMNFTINSTQCVPSSIFLYDLDSDGLLDVVVWGMMENNNCLQPFIQTKSGSFVAGQVLTMQVTSNPFVISYGINNAEKSTALLTFVNGSRTILKYQPGSQNYISIPYANIFIGANLTQIPFTNPHWNSFLDVTGDCRSDVVILDKAGNIEFWIANQRNFVFQNSINIGINNITSLSFADMNYDGVVEMVVATQSNIKVYENARRLKDYLDFCKPEYTSVQFLQSNITLTFPQGYTLVKNNLQIKDINIDGYPDLLVYLTPNGGASNQIVKIYLANYADSYEFVAYEQSQQYKLPVESFSNIISVSFIDFWENGILDIIVCTKNNGIMSFYNNYLQQNLFYIKGYGANGVSTTTGAQIVGANFYWVNSVGNGYKTTYQTQIAQTAYNALQTPFSYCGLGRANNYAESFTIGMYGQHNSWTPIIPNSQLAVYAQGSSPNQWAIRIFVLPTESLIYVVIVSAAVLTILGLVLVGLKCKNYRRKDQPLMEFIH